MSYRVLYLVGSLGAGGLERFVTRVAFRAQETGAFEPRIFCLNKREGIFLDRLENSSVPVYQAPPGWARHPGCLNDLAGLMRRIGAEVVHSQVNFSMAQQLLAVRLAGSAVFCVTERNQYTLPGWARLRRILQFHFLHLLGAHYSANSQAVADHLSNQVKTPVANLPVLPNGVPLIPANEEVRKQIRDQLNWDASDVGLGYVARMAAHKGHERFLDVLCKLRSKGYAIKACLVGDGPQHGYITGMLNKLGLQDIVTLAGVVSNVEDYLQAFDVVALFSSREGMPNAILEAMAAGKAIVATPVGAIPELLDNGHSGIIVSEPTIKNLASALITVIEDKDLRHCLGQQAHDRINRSFSLSVSFEKLLKYYDKIL